MSKLTEILDTMLDDSSFMGEIGPESEGAKERAEQAINAYIAEVIGEDMPMDMSFSRTNDQIIRDTCYTQGVNETKAEQRKRAGL